MSGTHGLTPPFRHDWIEWAWRKAKGDPLQYARLLRIFVRDR